MLTAEHAGIATTLTGKGRAIEWAIPDASAAFAGMESPSNDRLREVAERLASAGLTVTVSEGKRTLVKLGDVSSLLGRIALGSKRIRPVAVFRLLQLRRRMH